MSRVRVLVGTQKGAFILKSDGKRQKWDVTARTSPAGRSITSKVRPPIRTASTPRKPAAGSARSSSAPTTAAKPGSRPAAAEDQQPEGMPKAKATSSSTTRAAGSRSHAPVVRRHAASLGVQARLAPRTVAHRSRHRLRRRRRRRDVQVHRRRQNLAGTVRPARPRHRAPMAARRRRHGLHTILLDPKNPKRMFIAISAAGAFRTDDGGKTWKPINRGLRSQYIPDPNAEVGHCVHRIAMHPSRPDVLFMQKHWDVMRSDNAGDQWHEVSGNLPTDFGFPIDVHAHEPETIYVVPIKSDSRTFPARRQTARLPQPHRRQRMGAAHQRPAAKGLLRQRPARRHGRRLAGPLRHLFRHHRRPGVLLAPMAATTGTPIVRDLAGGALGRSADAAMIRVVLPPHLRTLAHVGRRSADRSRGPGDASRSVLDALEARYPMLRGTIRDHGTLQAPRRSCVSSRAKRICRTNRRIRRLPEAVVGGKEPFLVDRRHCRRLTPPISPTRKSWEGRSISASS